DLLLVEIGGEELAVLRFHAAVAAEIEVVALLGGDDAEVLALRFGAFARAARYGGLQLVRRPQALVPVLQPDGHGDGVLHAEAAPGVSHARLHRAQRFSIGMPGLEAGGDQLAPDVRELFEARTEELDALAARALRIEPELLRGA